MEAAVAVLITAPQTSRMTLESWLPLDLITTRLRGPWALSINAYEACCSNAASALKCLDILSVYKYIIITLYDAGLLDYSGHLYHLQHSDGKDYLTNEGVSIIHSLWLMQSAFRRHLARSVY